MVKNSEIATPGAHAYFKWAGWLHKRLADRQMEPRHLFYLCDEKIAMHRIWKWLRGEGVPHLAEGIMLFQRLGDMPTPDVVSSTNSKGQQVKRHPQLHFPGMAGRKGK